MAQRDKRIDMYILNAAPFAQPVLNHLRELVHAACPDVEETMKWSFPHFDYSGEILCSMAAFKNHCSFGFWKASLLQDKHKVLQQVGKTAMGSFGKITGIRDLPRDSILLSYIKEAAKLNERGIKTLVRKKTVRQDIPAPEELTKSLAGNPVAQKNFDSFSASHRREYIEWINEAKSDATKMKRLDTAIGWIAEGKGRNWKYERPKK